MNCDLHTHTVHSDGSYTPSELVAAAKEKNLVIALTDHNTMSGATELLAEAERLGVEVICGTELSAVYDEKEFHLLGLFISPEYFSRVEQLCLEYHSLKEESNLDLIDKLKKLGYDIEYEKIQRRNLKGRVNRAHIAAELIEKGYFATITQCFDELLDEKRGIYVPPKRLELCDAIDFLREVKALPILAHPLKDVEPDYLREILPLLISHGLVGIETMHSSYSEEKISVSKEIAAEFGLLESGGSDFHGTIKPDVELGTGRGNLEIKEEILLAMKARLAGLYD